VVWVYLGEMGGEEAVKEAEARGVEKGKRKMWENLAASRRNRLGCGSLCPAVCWKMWTEVGRDGGHLQRGVMDPGSTRAGIRAVQAAAATRGPKGT